VSALSKRRKNNQDRAAAWRTALHMPPAAPPPLRLRRSQKQVADLVFDRRRVTEIADCVPDERRPISFVFRVPVNRQLCAATSCRRYFRHDPVRGHRVDIAFSCGGEKQIDGQPGIHEGFQVLLHLREVERALRLLDIRPAHHSARAAQRGILPDHILLEQVQRALSVQRIKPNEHAMRRRRHCDARIGADAGRRDAFLRDIIWRPALSRCVTKTDRGQSEGNEWAHFHWHLPEGLAARVKSQDARSASCQKQTNTAI
jgi:hypothetical protein